MEFIGTFFLVLTIALTGNPIAIGAVLVAMVYMGGYISGAQYNPAVTLAVLMRGKMSSRDAIAYMFTQIIGGTFAALTYSLISNKPFVPNLGARVDTISALTLEILFTFALASVVLHVATSKRNTDNHYYGLAIGLTVMAGAFATGPISGGVLNPAVAVGPILLDVKDLSHNLPHLLIYIVGPLAGGALAAVVYKFVGEK